MMHGYMHSTINQILVGAERSLWYLGEPHTMVLVITTTMFPVLVCTPMNLFDANTYTEQDRDGDGDGDVWDMQ